MASLTINTVAAAAVPLPPSPRPCQAWEPPELTIAEQVEYAAYLASCMAEWKMLLTGLTVNRMALAYLYGLRFVSPGDDGELCLEIFRYADGYGGELYSTNPQNMGHRFTVAELEAELEAEQ